MATKSSRYVFQLVPSVRRTEESECGLLPTTQARDWRSPDKPESENFKRKVERGFTIDLNSRIAMLPTPAASIKRDLAAHLLWKGGMRALAHEHWNCDLFAMNKNLYGFEYEIKVSKADLRSELQIIDDIKAGVQPRRKHVGWRKCEKHEMYMRRKRKDYGHMRALWPNYFYFVVTPDLVEEAVAGCQGTRYGVMKATWGLTAGSDPKPALYFSVPKKAQRMHEEKMDLTEIVSLCHRLCWVAYNAIVDEYNRVIK